jgi:hypothetical protein
VVLVCFSICARLLKEKSGNDFHNQCWVDPDPNPDPPDPDPLVRGMDPDSDPDSDPAPDPSIIQQKLEEKP